MSQPPSRPPTSGGGEAGVAISRGALRAYVNERGYMPPSPQLTRLDERALQPLVDVPARARSTHERMDAHTRATYAFAASSAQQRQLGVSTRNLKHADEGMQRDHPGIPGQLRTRTASLRRRHGDELRRLDEVGIFSHETNKMRADSALHSRLHRLLVELEAANAEAAERKQQMARSASAPHFGAPVGPPAVSRRADLPA